MKPFLVICISILLTFSSTAQNDPEIPKWHIKYNLTSMVDLYAPYLQLSLEYPIAKRISIENELGWLNNRPRSLFDVGQKYAGVRSRNQIHFFIPEDSDILNYTFDLHLVGRYVAFPTQEYDYTRFNGAYRQKFEASPRYYDIGFLVGGSTVFYLKNAPISFEIGAAIGTKRAFITEGNENILPEDAATADPWAFDINIIPANDFEDRRYFICLINLKMGVFFNQGFKE